MKYLQKLGKSLMLPVAVLPVAAILSGIGYWILNTAGENFVQAFFTAAGGALLDVTEPEPLPADDPLWAFDNVQITMHLSGRAQDTVYAGAVERFLANLEAYRAGRQPQPLYDPAAGY